MREKRQIAKRELEPTALMGTDGMVQLMIILFRFLIGILPSGIKAVRPVEVSSVGAGGAFSTRRGLRLVIPQLGWIDVGPLLGSCLRNPAMGCVEPLLVEGLSLANRIDRSAHGRRAGDRYMRWRRSRLRH